MFLHTFLYNLEYGLGSEWDMFSLTSAQFDVPMSLFYGGYSFFGHYEGNNSVKTQLAEKYSSRI